MNLRPLLILLVTLLPACAANHDLPADKPGFASEPVYDYPINNPYAATVIGLPPEMKIDYSKVPETSEHKITIFENREIPEGYWYERGLKYGELIQGKPAPLVYVVAGAGADHRAEKMRTLGTMLYSAGFSVVLLPSPILPNFIINAGENFTPGRPLQDASDLYRVMKIIDKDVSARATVTERYLTGYSLGAIDAAFTAKLDDQEKSLNFNRVLLINPPYSLYSSVKIIDAMLHSALPNGVDDADKFIKGAIMRLSSVSQNGDALDFSNERLLIEAYNKYQPSDNRLATTIGLSFRLTAASMIFTADVMGHRNYIFPGNREFTTSTPLNHYMAVALRSGFSAYFDELYSKQYAAQDPRLTKAELARESTLEELHDYIAHNPKFGLITNQDDPILAAGELDKMKVIFGKNAVVFSNGGHVGNLAHPAVTYHIVKFLKGEQW